MKQYTTPEQTAKLIELGVEKPKGWYANGVTNNIKLYVSIGRNPMMFNYSIGELIEMLPECEIAGMTGWYIVKYDNEHYYGRGELIDALYLLIVELKEEGVI